MTVASIFLAALVVGISDPTRSNFEADWDFCYGEALRMGGHAPVIIQYDDDTNRLEAVISRIDLLLLTGGSDVDPARYGAVPSSKLKRVLPERDRFDFTLMELARRRRLPIVGICRGGQALNVFFGGTLWQDIPSEHPGAKTNATHRGVSVGHVVDVKPGSRLASVFGTKPLLVNTYHHQAVKDVAPGFIATAFAPDGVVECIEGLSYPAIGVQFHPEILCVESGAKTYKSPYCPDFVKFFANLPILTNMEGKDSQR